MADFEAVRPATLNEIVGQWETLRGLAALLDAHDAGKPLPHLLFFGPPGSGKTTAARVIGKHVESHPYEVNAAIDRGLEFVRKDIGQLVGQLTDGRYKVIILNEADRMTSEARSALQSLLEESQEHEWARFIFVTNHPEKLEKPLKSRLLEFEFRSLRVDDLKLLGRRAATRLGIEIADERLAQLAREAKGDARYVIHRLSLPAPEPEATNGSRVVRPRTRPADLVSAPRGGRPEVALDDVAEAVRLNDSGRSYRQIAEGATAHNVQGKLVKTTQSLVAREVQRWRREHPKAAPLTASKTVSGGVDKADSGDLDIRREQDHESNGRRRSSAQS